MTTNNADHEITKQTLPEASFLAALAQEYFPEFSPQKTLKRMQLGRVKAPL